MPQIYGRIDAKISLGEVDIRGVDLLVFGAAAMGAAAIFGPRAKHKHQKLLYNIEMPKNGRDRVDAAVVAIRQQIGLLMGSPVLPASPDDAISRIAESLADAAGNTFPQYRLVWSSPAGSSAAFRK